MKKVFAKYIVMGILALMGYKAAAQDADAPAPFPAVQVTDWKDIFSLTVYAESETVGESWTPVLGLVPDINIDVNFKNKFKASAQTNYFVHNWGDPEHFAVVPFTMSVAAAAQTRAGDFGARVGHLYPHAGYCLEGAWDGTTPLAACFFSAIYLDSGGNIPKAAMAEWRRDGDGVFVGYIEKDNEKSGFAFDGTNPAIAVATEKSFARGALRIRGGFASGPNRSGSVYVLCKPTKNLELLANCVNIGTKQIGATAGQKYSITTKNGGALTLQATEIWQKDGVTSAWMSVCFPFGAYINLGAVKDDPRFDADGIRPFFGIGYAGMFKIK